MLDIVESMYESAHWRVILAKDQEILGRCVIVCKEPVGSMSELTDEQWLDFSRVVKKMEAAAKRAFGATMCNWTCLMNYAYRNDPPDPQVHWHFRPRYNKPVEFAGLKFEDTEFGSHYARSTERIVGDEVMEKIRAAYRAALG